MELLKQPEYGFSGWLSDKLQKRKSIALVGYLLAAIAKPLIGLSTGWQGVLGARFLDRFGTGTRSAPRDALIASSADEEHRGKAFGLEGISDNLGAFLGPMLAVFLLLFRPWRGISLWRGVRSGRQGHASRWNTASASIAHSESNQCRQTRSLTKPWESPDSTRPKHALKSAKSHLTQIKTCGTRLLQRSHAPSGNTIMPLPIIPRLLPIEAIHLP